MSSYSSKRRAELAQNLKWLEEYRKKERERSRARRAQKKDKWCSKHHTKAMVEEREKELEQSRIRNRRAYWKNKLGISTKDAAGRLKQEPPQKMCLRDVAPEECCLHNNKMSSYSSKRRAELAQNPKWLEEYRKKERERSRARRAQKKNKWLNKRHTKAMVEEREKELEQSRIRNRRAYWKNKLGIGTGAAAERLKQELSQRICPRDMTPEERRLHNNRLRAESRARQSSHKRYHVLEKDREYRRRKKAAMTASSSSLSSPTQFSAAGPSLEGPSPATSQATPGPIVMTPLPLATLAAATLIASLTGISSGVPVAPPPATLPTPADAPSMLLTDDGAPKPTPPARKKTLGLLSETIFNLTMHIKAALRKPADN